MTDKIYVVVDKRTGEFCYTDLHTILRKRYKYVLENWEEAVKWAKQGHSARGSAYGRYFLGQSEHVRRSGIESSIRHKGISVTVTWSEIRSFIQDMLEPDQQLSMFDLLLEGACS